MRWAAERRGLVADLRRQLAELEVRIAHRHARGAVGLILEQAFELAVEVGRALQQLVAQRLELLGLEHQVVADLAVEQLDRLHRQVEPLLLAPLADFSSALAFVTRSLAIASSVLA